MIVHDGREHGTRGEYAAHIKASAAYVTKLGHQGRLVEREIDGKKLVDFPLTDKLIRNTADLSKARNGANAQPGRQPSMPIAAAGDGGKVDAIYRQAQAQERAFHAKLAELEYRRAVGELVRAADVRAAQSRKLASLRDALLQLPARLAPVLAAETDAGRIDELLQQELAQVLAQLVNGGHDGSA